LALASESSRSANWALTPFTAIEFPCNTDKGVEEAFCGEWERDSAREEEEGRLEWDFETFRASDALMLDDDLDAIKLDSRGGEDGVGEVNDLEEDCSSSKRLDPESDCLREPSALSLLRAPEDDLVAASTSISAKIRTFRLL
jgi:hypothetical protein